MRESLNEKVIDVIAIEGVEFTVVEKTAALYAGSYYEAPDLEAEPDIGASWKFYQDHKNKIAGSLTPDCMICISINYVEPSLPCAMLHGQETINRNQPEGINIIETPPTMFIKVNATEQAWTLTKKLTGEDNPQWHMAPLFGLIKHIFCNEHGGYEYNANGNHEIEYYYDDGHNGVAVPVRKVIDNETI